MAAPFVDVSVQDGGLPGLLSTTFVDRAGKSRHAASKGLLAAETEFSTLDDLLRIGVH
jgi:hypothetical protein